MDLQRWGERLFGIPPADPGLGTSWKIETNFPWPTWGLLLFLIAGTGVVIWTYRRDGAGLSRQMRAILVTLRMFSICCLLFFLSGAVISLERTSLPYLLVLLDHSRSMQTPDQFASSELQTQAKSWMETVASEKAGPQPTRLNLAKGLLSRGNGRVLRSLLRTHKLRLYSFAEKSQRLGGFDILNEDDLQKAIPLIQELEAGGTQTRPGTAVKEVLNEMRGSLPTALILLTDGINTGEEGDRLKTGAEIAIAQGVPLINVGFGNEDPISDLAVVDTLVDEVAFVDDPITFRARIKKTGEFSGKVQVTLKQVGNDAPLDKKEVELPATGDPPAIELMHTPHGVGDLEFVVEVQPLEREFRVDNNSERRQVSVRNEKIRVLLVESSPRYEYRYLKHLLEREKTIELASVLQDSAPEYATEDRTALPHFPVRKEELFSYDVLILGDLLPDQIAGSSLEQVREFVSEKGGGVVFIAGPRSNPRGFRGTALEGLLPMELADLRPVDPDQPITESSPVTLTPEGRHGSGMYRLADSEGENLQVWSHLPPLFWFLPIEKLKSGAIPFASISSSGASETPAPLIIMQRFGAGKVLFHATDETWRWRFRVGDLYFGRLWVQTIRYLARSRLTSQDRQLQLILDRSQYEVGETVQMRAQFLDDRLAPSGENPVVVMIEKPGTPPRKVELRRKSQAGSLFEGQVSQLPEGSYHAIVTQPSVGKAPPSADFRVDVPTREISRLQMDQSELKSTAEMTHGTFLRWNEGEKLSEVIPPGRPITLRSEDPITLWNHWLGLTLFMMSLTTEWILRKRNRLL